MRVIVEIESSQSPGVNIIGSREDLLSLSEALRCELEKIPDRAEPGSDFISIPGLQCESAEYEWLGFQVCDDLQARLQAEQKKKKSGCALALAIALVAIAILYLAYRGIGTFQ
jgi:hypothetical protein